MTTAEIQRIGSKFTQDAAQRYAKYNSDLSQLQVDAVTENLQHLDAHTLAEVQYTAALQSTQLTSAPLRSKGQNPVWRSVSSVSEKSRSDDM